jgi:hypothetical protein
MVADHNLSFEFPTSDTFQAYAHFMRPDAAKNLPCSSTTLRAWIPQAHNAQNKAMIEPGRLWRATGGRGHVEELRGAGGE